MHPPLKIRNHLSWENPKNKITKIRICNTIEKKANHIKKTSSKHWIRLDCVQTKQIGSISSSTQQFSS